MSEKLLPCPFCGSAYVEQRRGDDRVRCLSCDARGPYVKSDDSREVNRAWNHRAAITPIDGGGSDAVEEVRRLIPASTVNKKYSAEMLVKGLARRGWRLTPIDGDTVSVPREVLAEAMNATDDLSSVTTIMGPDGHSRQAITRTRRANDELRKALAAADREEGKE